MDIGLKAQSTDKYNITCKQHKCPGPMGRGDIFVHVHGLAKVRPEVQDAMAVLLAELYTSDAPADKCPLSGEGPVRLHPMPVMEGPLSVPGIHFHTPPDLATVRGFLCAMDAGHPDAENRKKARGAEFIDDPEVMAAAIV